MAGEREFGLGVETALLGRDEHHAAGRTRTVDRRSAGVLDDLDGLDVVQVVVAVVVAGHAVDDEQRVQAVDRPDAADHDIRTAARLAAGLRDHHAGHLTLQSLSHGTGRNVLEIIRFHGSDRTRQIRFRLRSVTHNDHVVQPFGLFFEDDLQFIAVQYREFQALVTDIGDEQGRTRGDLQRKGTVRTGDRTAHGRSILDDNGGTDERVAVFVRHLAGNGAFGRLCRLAGRSGRRFLIRTCRRGKATQQEQDDVRPPAHKRGVTSFHKSGLSLSKPGSIGMPKQSRRNKSRENQNFAAKEVFRSVWKTSTKVWKKSTLRMWKTPVLPVHGISSYRKRGSQRFQHLTGFFGILASYRNGTAPPLSNESPGAKNVRLSPWKRYRNGAPVRSVRMAAGIARLPPKPARRRDGGERRSDTMANRPPEADARRTANRRPGIRRPQLRTADAP